MELELKYVWAKKRSNGRVRYYFRRENYPRRRLPGIPGSREFIAAYHKAIKATPLPAVAQAPSLGAKPGTIKALVIEYRNSSAFAKLAKSTKYDRGYTLDRLVKNNGDKLVKAITRKTILLWQDNLKNKPGAANKMVRTLSLLFEFSIAREYRSDNPATGIELMKQGEHRAWTPEEMATYEARWPLGTQERAGYALARYTTQRRGDAVKFTFADFAAGGFQLKQQKTGNKVKVENLHPELVAAIQAMPHQGGQILTHKDGKPMSGIYFGGFMAKAIAAAGLPDDCVLHGLRKSAAVEMIEAGCTPHQAAAITGHSNIRMLEEYAKDRDQTKLANDAMTKWKGAKKRGSGGGTPPA